MNSYNENLHAAIAVSLNDLDTKQSTRKSSLKASTFTLYYKQGDRITAAENLETANSIYAFQQTVKHAAVNNSNISINVLNSANQQKKYTAQSVTNVASCAANIQVLSSAVVRLSKDVGSIYTDLVAGDYGTEIFLQSRKAYELMIDTAYDAQRLSESAMKASLLTAAVSAPEVADEAKLTNDSIAAILNIASSDFDSTAVALAGYNAAVSEASAVEKKAEGNLEFINVEYFASTRAYNANSKALNLNLTAVALNKSADPTKMKENSSYVVRFNPYQFAFQQPDHNDAKKPERVVDGVKDKGYPVKNYYIMLAKESSQSVFSTSTAESLLLNESQYITLPNVPEKEYFEKILYTDSLLDSDGDPMEIGQKYVVFVLAEFTEEYKKNINNYVDFLSAPSTSFMLSNRLSAPKAEDIKIKDKTLNFELNEKSGYKVEYRCMFLPDCTLTIPGLLTEKGLRTIEAEVEKQEKVEEEYAPAIEGLNTQVITLQNTLDGLNEQFSDGDKKIEAEIKEVEDQLAQTKKELKNKERALNRSNKFSAVEQSDQPGFFFNLMLAEQVSRANYTPAQTDPADKDDQNGMVKISGEVVIDEDTTDNFGNPLKDGSRYIPVILSYSLNEGNEGQFINAVSAFENTKSFSYKA